MKDYIYELERQGFEVESLCHAYSILSVDFSAELEQLYLSLRDLELPITEIIGSGGGETKFTQRLRRRLSSEHWKKHNFIIEKIVDGRSQNFTSHEIDHVKHKPGMGTIACEIEWNNKDPFFDRDLENFKRLHSEGAINVGIIITRGRSLQNSLADAVYAFIERHDINSFKDLERHGYYPTAKQREKVERQTRRIKNPLTFRDSWVRNFISNKYGQATTHWSKLMDRIERGVGHPCPLLIIGLPSSMICIDNNLIENLDENDEE